MFSQQGFAVRGEEGNAMYRNEYALSGDGEYMTRDKLSWGVFPTKAEAVEALATFFERWGASHSFTKFEVVEIERSVETTTKVTVKELGG